MALSGFRELDPKFLSGLRGTCGSWGFRDDTGAFSQRPNPMKVVHR